MTSARGIGSQVMQLILTSCLPIHVVSCLPVSEQAFVTGRNGR
jgi:hypothetical protein